MDLPLNKILLKDCIEGMKELPEKSIDLIVTSPPYFNTNKKHQRGTGFHYNIDIGEPLFTTEDMFEHSYRIVKDDGFLCINLGFSYGETGILRPFYVIQRAIKFNWFPLDVIVWIKSNPIPIRGRLTNAFEYIFVLSKIPQTQYPNAENMNYVPNIIQTSVNKPKDADFHSAVFPIEIPLFCITHFSKQNDIVLDPFMGSGTTAIACKQLKRNYIGYDISSEYVEKATKRVQEYIPKQENCEKKNLEKFFKY